MACTKVCLLFIFKKAENIANDIKPKLNDLFTFKLNIKEDVQNFMILLLILKN